MWNTGWIFHRLFTQRNADTRQTGVGLQDPHKYMSKYFFKEFTSKCIKIFPSIIHKCIFLNYLSRGIVAPRSCEFFISPQLQTADLVKGTQIWGVGIAAGQSWQDFQSLGNSRCFITAKQRNKSRSIKIRNKRARRAELRQYRFLPHEGPTCYDFKFKMYKAYFFPGALYNTQMEAVENKQNREEARIFLETVIMLIY